MRSFPYSELSAPAIHASCNERIVTGTNNDPFGYNAQSGYYLDRESGSTFANTASPIPATAAGSTAIRLVTAVGRMSMAIALESRWVQPTRAGPLCKEPPYHWQGLTSWRA